MAVNAGARLDRLPITSFHWRMLGLIGAGMFLDGFEVYLGGGVLGALVKDGWSDMAHNAQFISATFAGMFIGSWMAGILGDRFGRRFSYQANLMIFGLASFGAALAPSMEWLIVARFVMGLGLGAEIVIGYVTLTEFVPPDRRGRWGAGLATITSSALFFSSLLGYALIPTVGWRWMFVIVGVGAVIVWYLRKKMPESPRWLESKGHLEEAERVMSEIEAEVSRSKPLPPVVPVAVVAPVQRSVMALFSRELLPRTITGSIILITMNTALYGFIAWLPTFFVKQGVSVVTSLGYTTAMSLGGPVGAAIGMYLSDRLGRRPGIMVFSAIAIVLGLIYPQMSDPMAIGLVGFALVTSIYVLLAFTWSLYIPELFPTDIRMRGAGFCNTVGRLMTILTPYMVITAFTAYGVLGVVATLSTLLLLQLIVVGLLGIETKRQPLEALAPDGQDALLGMPMADGSRVRAID
ncbi:MAG: major facilitator superfamily 1 [Rhodospirillales bacterium]|nr:major facilitator superfamily 1 [Rhodospirillales bacterium]